MNARVFHCVLWCMNSIFPTVDIKGVRHPIYSTIDFRRSDIILPISPLDLMADGHLLNQE